MSDRNTSSDPLTIAEQLRDLLSSTSDDPQPLCDRAGDGLAALSADRRETVVQSLILALEDAATAERPVEDLTPVEGAWRVLRGELTGSNEGREIVGAQNDYSSRGRGETTARRVLRNGSWEWVSEPASRGRSLAADRKDTKYGAVYEGEIVAGYTLGSRRPTPDQFWLVVDDEKPLVRLDHKKVKGGYRLVGTSSGNTIDVPDPAWK